MTSPGPVTPDSGDELVRIANHAYGRKEMENLGALRDDLIDIGGFVSQHDPMRAALAAVRPPIEAEAAVKWAAEIREGAAIYATGARLGLGLGGAVPLPDPLAAYHRGMTDVAARIERGEKP